MTKEEAFRNLWSCGGHAILKPDFAAQVGKAFGFKPHLYQITDNRSQFKGAQIEGVEEGDSVNAIDALQLMSQLADSVGYSIKADYFGRGSQFAAGMTELAKYLGFKVTE